MKHDHDFETYMRNVLDTGHSIRKEADAPPVGTWQRVLAQAPPKSEKRNEMSSNTIATSAVPYAPAIPQHRRGFGHYMNLAATIALVLAVAVAGWFATMQLNQPNGSDSRFALVGQSDEAAICDVEPLTVDEVMEIVRNPYRYMFERADSDASALVSYELMAQQELAVGYYFPSVGEFNSVNRTTPAEVDFEEASSAVNTYVACMRDATNGLYWALLHPIAVQEQVLGRFPVFADEESVRSHVEEVIDEPVRDISNRLSGFYSTYGDVSIIANPDPEKADLILYASADYEPTIAMGVLVTDENGDVILETGSTGYPHQIQPGAVTLRPVIVVQKSSATGVWYVMPLGRV